MGDRRQCAVYLFSALSVVKSGLSVSACQLSRRAVIREGGSAFQFSAFAAEILPHPHLILPDPRAINPQPSSFNPDSASIQRDPTRIKPAVRREQILRREVVNAVNKFGNHAAMRQFISRELFASLGSFVFLLRLAKIIFGECA